MLLIVDVHPYQLEFKKFIYITRYLAMFEESSLSILREECGNKEFFSGKVWSINFRFRYVYKTPAKCDLDNDIYFERPCNKPQMGEQKI